MAIIRREVVNPRLVLLTTSKAEMFLANAPHIVASLSLLNISATVGTFLILFVFGEGDELLLKFLALLRLPLLTLNSGVS